MFVLNEILEYLEKENNANKKSHFSLIKSIFQGTMTTVTKCFTCELSSSRDETFLDIPVDIEENCSINHCLLKFSKPEKLYGNNKFYCESCMSLQEAEKTTLVKKLPQILILHLKRFKYMGHLDKLTKVSHRVSFALELRLVPDDCLYNLLAVIIHLGVGANSGHYISIIRSKNTWILFDDDKRQIFNPENFVKSFGLWNYNPEIPQNSSTGYILLYEKSIK